MTLITYLGMYSITSHLAHNKREKLVLLFLKGAVVYKMKPCTVIQVDEVSR